MNENSNLQRWSPVAVSEVKVPKRQRPLAADHVQRLRESFERLGGQLQLQPIVLDRHYVLIDGAHRLEAARQSGWSHIAAVVLGEVSSPQRAMLEIEANRVRKNLNPVELEQAWRDHYEPQYRAVARERRTHGLRRGSVGPVIGNSDNGANDSPSPIAAPKFTAQDRVSLAKAAKDVTGMSIETLNKIAEIRAVSVSKQVSETLRDTALSGLRRIGKQTASVESVYRALQQHMSQGGDSQPSARDSARLQHQVAQQALEHVLRDTTLLDERLSGSFARELERAARLNAANREQLRAIRVSLARSLATVVSAECRLKPQVFDELRVIGAEVSKLLSSTSVMQLRSQSAHD